MNKSTIYNIFTQLVYNLQIPPPPKGGSRDTQVKDMWKGQRQLQKSSLINVLAISGNFKKLWFFQLKKKNSTWKKILMQVLSLIEASEAVLEEKQWQQQQQHTVPYGVDQWEASIYCTQMLSTNKLSHQNRPPGGVGGLGGGTEFPIFRNSPAICESRMY